MREHKIHIKRDGQKTFCGCAFGIYRATKQQIEIRKRRGKPTLFHKEELPTNTYNNATCVTCKNSFKVLAQLVAEQGNLLAFFTLGQAHIVKVTPNYYPESVQYGA